MRSMCPVAPAPLSCEHPRVVVGTGQHYYRRDRERHENVLVDTAGIPRLFAAHGVDARVVSSFGAETLPEGLRVVVGHRRG